jgi:hypothetical protein
MLDRHDPVPPRDLQALKRAICARARDFEIAPLLDLLATMGYRPGDVYFRGHVTETPQPTLLHHIEFAGVDGLEGLEGELAGPASGPGPSLHLGSIVELAEPAVAPGAMRAGHPSSQVTITVNLGLLSCRSPLPSYFQQLLRDPSFHEPLLELLQIIDRNLLRARLTCDRPERIVDRWDEITGDLLRIHGLDSLVGLSWLFRHVFPELPATVQRTSEQLRVPYASARLGFSDLGSASLGAATRIDVHDFQITLRCEDAVMRPGVPWLHEVDRRLRTIVFPALDPVCMNLTVVLELGDRTAAMLRDDRDPPRGSYLGQDSLGKPGAGSLSPRRVVLYRGLLPRNQPDTDELERALADEARVTVTAPGGGSRAPTAPGGDAPEDTRTDGELDRACDLELTLALGGHDHRYQATVRWGARAWFRDEPYAIELRSDHLAQAAPTARHHPQVWSLLRDQARRAVAAELATATLAHYGAATVTDAMVADLLARDQHGALHALLADGAASDVPPAAWERYLRAQP